MRLTHLIKNRRRAMLGSYLELAADMIFNKLTEKRIVRVFKHIIISYSRANEHLFDLRQFANGSKNIKIFAVVGFQSLAGCRCKALFALTKTLFKLNETACAPKVRSRAAYIVNVAFKIRLFCKHFCFFDNRFLASCRNKSALMKRYRAEVTCAEAASVMCN